MMILLIIIITFTQTHKNTHTHTHSQTHAQTATQTSEKQQLTCDGALSLKNQCWNIDETYCNYIANTSSILFSLYIFHYISHIFQ